MTRAFALAEAMAFLQRTPVVIDALLRGMPDDWIAANEGADTWSPFDVVGHLVHGERTDWMPRIRMVLEQGESQPFASFNRAAQFTESKGKSIADLLDEFATLRRNNLAMVAALRL